MKAEERDPWEYLEGAIRRSRANWDEMFREEPELARCELTIARCARILAVDHPNAPAVAQAILEDRRARDERFRLWQAKAAERAA